MVLISVLELCLLWNKYYDCVDGLQFTIYYNVVVTQIKHDIRQALIISIARRQKFMNRSLLNEKKVLVFRSIGGAALALPTLTCD